MSSSSGEDGELAQKSGRDSDSGSDRPPKGDGPSSDEELAQKSGSDKPPKGDGSGSDKPPKVESSDSGSGSDGELAQKSGSGKSGKDSDGSGPDLDSEDLEALEKELGLAQEGDDAP